MTYPSMTVHTADTGDGIPRVNVVRVCPACEKESHVDAVPTEGFMQWQAGTSIQHALPYLTDGQRETLKTGLHEPCFDAMFDSSDEDEELIDYDPWTMPSPYIETDEQ